MRLGKQHKQGFRRSRTTGKVLFVVEYEIHIHEDDMTALGTDVATAIKAINFMLMERTRDKAKIAELQTQLGNTIPTDGDTNTVLGTLSATVATIPPEVLADAPPPAL